jgi:translation initiation factor 1
MMSLDGLQPSRLIIHSSDYSVYDTIFLMGFFNERKSFIMPDRVVYSTDSGRITTCPNCGQPFKDCRCNQSAALTKKSDGIVRVMRDRKQRGGKTVTVVMGLPQDVLTTLGQQFKKLCGSGGTIKEDNIEIQGDHCEKVMAKLTDLGYKVKRAGG